MRSETVIYLRWKLTGRVEVFVNLGKLYSYYSDVEMGVSRHTLNKKDLSVGYQNSIIEVRKLSVFS